MHKAGNIQSLFSRPETTFVAFISILSDKPPHA